MSVFVGALWPFLEFRNALPGARTVLTQDMDILKELKPGEAYYRAV